MWEKGRCSNNSGVNGGGSEADELHERCIYEARRRLTKIKLVELGEDDGVKYGLSGTGLENPIQF